MKKDFHIIRLSDKGVKIKKKDGKHLQKLGLLSDKHENMTGGKTYWYDLFDNEQGK